MDSVARAASADAAGASVRLGFQAGGEHWVVRLEDAAEVVALGALTPVPLTRAWFRGLTNVRGHLYSVIDFGAFVANRPAPQSIDTRLILINDRYHVAAGLLVERMLGLRTPQQLEPIASTGPALDWATLAYRDAEGRIWREIAMAELVYSNDFLNVSL